MIVAYGNKLIGFNGKVIDWSTPNTPWTFTWTGSKFGGVYPFTFDFRFLYPASITVDWGDGNTLVYNAYDTGVANIPNGRYLISFQLNSDGSNPNGATGHYGYFYPDGLNILRTIKLYVGNRSALFSINNVGVTNQPLNLSFAQFPALSSISFGNVTLNPLNIPDITALPNLTSFSFVIVTPYMPIEVCLTHLTSFSFSIPLSTNSFLDRSFSDTNMDKLPLLKPTLKNLTITNVVKNLDGSDPFPANWSTFQLTALTLNQPSSATFLSLIARFYEKLPSVFENMVTLINLVLSPLSDWSNMLGLTGLTNLIVAGYGSNYGGVYLPLDVPSFITTNTVLKTINTRGIFRAAPDPQAAIDTFINNIYNFVVANTAITGSNSVPLRFVNWNLNSTSGAIVSTTTDADVTSKAPSGTYQQPAGYVSGGNNGSPASPMEKAWVLVSQYKWTLTFPPAVTGTTIPLNVTVVITSTTQLRVTFSISAASTTMTSFYFNLTYKISSTVTAVKYNAINIATGSTTGILNLAVNTAGIIQASVSVYGTYSNPISTGAIITYTNPFTTNF